MYKPKIGDTVTCLYAVEAYYSNYGTLPACHFMPGDTGIVAHTDLPSVCRERVTFSCVDFTKDGRRWRVALTRDNIKRIRVRAGECNAKT